MNGIIEQLESAPIRGISVLEPAASANLLAHTLASEFSQLLVTQVEAARQPEAPRSRPVVGNPQAGQAHAPIPAGLD